MAERALTDGAKPILKWAGGKTQLLPVLKRFLPDRPFRYLEPMIGGGALFFSVAPERAIIADSNPELINLYRSLVHDMEALIANYEAWPFDEATFYQIRALKFEDLPPSEAAARTIYLNRGCFNGLYRVNRSGAFNVPWGRYKQAYRIDRGNFAKAQNILKGAEVILGDFREVLRTHAEPGDFIFLDPPYVPISANADFKRYTRDQFQDDDHIQMAALAKELANRGCDVLITNSNHPLVHDLYRDYQIEVVPTKRNVNSRGSGRSGEDTIIYVNRS